MTIATASLSASRAAIWSSSSVAGITASASSRETSGIAAAGAFGPVGEAIGLVVAGVFFAVAVVVAVVVGCVPVVDFFVDDFARASVPIEMPTMHKTTPNILRAVINPV